jgi:hypothetical protein
LSSCGVRFSIALGEALGARLLRATKDGRELSPIAPELGGSHGEPSGQHQANVERVVEIRDGT